MKFYASAGEKAQVIKPINGDPFIGMLETPVTSAPVAAQTFAPTSAPVTAAPVQFTSAPVAAPTPSFLIVGTGVVLGDASSGVIINATNCITDGVGNYGASESATITALVAGTIDMKGEFHTESTSYDYLTIQSSKYGGGTPPPGTITLSAGETLTSAALLP